MTPRVNDTKDNLENSVRRLMIPDVASKILEVDGYFIDLWNVVFLKVMEIPEVAPQAIPSIENDEEEV